MYDYIQGEVTELTPAYAVVEAGGVGYYLVISLQTYAELEHLSSARVLFFPVNYESAHHPALPHPA